MLSCFMNTCAQFTRSIFCGLLVFCQNCDITRSHIATLHKKHLTCFVNIAFPCFDKMVSGDPGDILQMGRLAWMLGKSDRTLLKVTHSTLNFIFNFHLAPLVDGKEKGHTQVSSKGISGRRAGRIVGHSVTAVIGHAMSSSLLRKWDQEQHGIIFAQKATKSYNHGAGRPAPIFYRQENRFNSL